MRPISDENLHAFPKACCDSRRYWVRGEGVVLGAFVRPKPPAFGTPLWRSVWFWARRWRAPRWYMSTPPARAKGSTIGTRSTTPCPTPWPALTVLRWVTTTRAQLAESVVGQNGKLNGVTEEAYASSVDTRTKGVLKSYKSRLQPDRFPWSHPGSSRRGGFPVRGEGE